MPPHDSPPRSPASLGLPISIHRFAVRSFAPSPTQIAKRLRRSARISTEGWGVALQNLTTGFRVTKSGSQHESGWALP